MKVAIGAIQEIWDMTVDEKAKIIDDLTLLNSVYVKALQYSPYGKVYINKYNEYYTHLNGVIAAPRGYKIPFPHEVVSDERFTLENVEYPKFMLKLRDVQKEAAKAYLSSRKNGDGVVVVSTGLGKSILGLYLAGELKQRVLIVVQKDDLITNWKIDATQCYGFRPKQIGIIKAKEYRLGRWITLTTIQTFYKLPKEKLEELRKHFSMIIVDEFHHSAAQIYELVNTFPAYDRIGLTATDMRNDGLGDVLNFYFGGVCYRYGDTDETTDIIPPKDVKIVVRNSDISYAQPTIYVSTRTGKPVDMIRTLNGDIKHVTNLNTWELAQLIDSRLIKKKPLNYSKVVEKIQDSYEFNQLVCEDIKFEYGNNKSCIIFCKEKDHVKAIEQHLIMDGVPASTIQLYYGDAKGKNAKEEMKEKAESKEKLITIATYAIATEGTNVRSWERMFFAMTFNNEKDTIQAIGRGRRTFPGKTDLVVYDYRHPGVVGAAYHGKTRDAVYCERGFKYLDRVPVNRGWGAVK
jgi:superfamily II DNA or RNA helicase